MTRTPLASHKAARTERTGQTAILRSPEQRATGRLHELRGPALVNHIVEYIRSAGDFPFDCDDVLEQPKRVLDHFELYVQLDSNEWLGIIEELLDMAEAAEIAEASRAATAELVGVYICAGNEGEWP